jgi:hypothetical protein
MIEPRVLYELVERFFDVLEVTRSLETRFRQDSDYSTILARKR